MSFQILKIGTIVHIAVGNLISIDTLKFNVGSRMNQRFTAKNRK